MPVATSIVDSSGATWTLRLSDRTPLRNGVSTGLSNVLQVWYLASSIWAYMGTGWQRYSSGAWAASTKPNMPTTAGLRLPVGPQVLASHAGVQISAGTNIQAVVNANPAGTTYVLGIGTHTSQSIVPKTGDTFIGLYNGTNGAVLDGASNTANAFYSLSASYVTIQNLFIKNYTCATQHGQVEVTGPYLTIQNCDISLATQASGVYVADYALVIANRIHHNAQQGYAVHGDIVSNYRSLVGILFDSNEIDNNNPSQAIWAGSEQGGGKALYTQYLTFWYNYSHDNGGSNFWTDANNIYTNYYCNKVGPGWNGIEHEISYDVSIIGNDLTTFNGPASGVGNFLSNAAIILENSGGVSASNGCEIAYNNIVCGQYARGITMRQQNRGVGNLYNVGLFFWVRNVSVHHNTTDTSASTISTGLFGVGEDTGDTYVFWGQDHATFDYNTYIVGSNYVQFVWNDQPNLSFQQWQSYGHDLHGTGPGPQPPSWSSLNKNSQVVISGGSLVATGFGGTTDSGRGVDSTLIRAGDKRYFEITITTSTPGIGLCTAAQAFGNADYLGDSTSSIGRYADGTLWYNAASFATIATYVTGDVMNVAVEGGNKVWFGVNGVYDGNPSAGTGGRSIAALGDVYPAYTLAGGRAVTGKFAATFAYTPPTGFTALPVP